MQTFVAAFDTLFGGFRQRAQTTFALLQADQTAFLVVAAPEPDALREAAYFVERLGEDRMPLAGTDREPGEPCAGRGRCRPTRRWRPRRGSRPSGLSRSQRGCCASTPTGLGWSSGRRRCATRFAAAHPSVPTAVVPALAGDVHDLDGLRQVGTLLADG